MARKLCFCGRLSPCAHHPATRRPRRNPLRNTAAWRRARQAVLYRDGHRCRRCGFPATPFEPLHVHHVVARAEGGTDALENLVTLCALCHPKLERQAGVFLRASGGDTTPVFREGQ
jgi:5-methylcytosine-specific restriction endonuclease McrA